MSSQVVTTSFNLKTLNSDIASSYNTLLSIISHSFVSSISPVFSLKTNRKIKCKIKILNRSENIPKSFRWLLFWNTCIKCNKFQTKTYHYYDIIIGNDNDQHCYSNGMLCYITIHKLHKRSKIGHLVSLSLKFIYQNIIF